MPTKPDYRDLIVDCPACKGGAQKEFMDGTIYNDFDALLRSVRRGSIVRIYRPFLLGGGFGRTDKQRLIEALHICRDSWGDNAIISSTFIAGLPTETIELPSKGLVYPEDNPLSRKN